MSMVHNRFSLIATIIGAFSILVILASQSFEREYAQSKPKIEQIVHEKVSSIKKQQLMPLKEKISGATCRRSQRTATDFAR